MELLFNYLEVFGVLDKVSSGLLLVLTTSTDGGEIMKSSASQLDRCPST